MGWLQIYSGRFGVIVVDLCYFWGLFTLKMIESVKVFPFTLWKIIIFFYFIEFKPRHKHAKWPPSDLTPWTLTLGVTHTYYWWILCLKYTFNVDLLHLKLTSSIRVPSRFELQVGKKIISILYLCPILVRDMKKKQYSFSKIPKIKFRSGMDSCNFFLEQFVLVQYWKHVYFNKLYIYFLKIDVQYRH